MATLIGRAHAPAEPGRERLVSDVIGEGSKWGPAGPDPSAPQPSRLTSEAAGYRTRFRRLSRGSFKAPASSSVHAGGQIFHVANRSPEQARVVGRSRARACI